MLKTSFVRIYFADVTKLLILSFQYNLTFSLGLIMLEKNTARYLAKNSNNSIINKLQAEKSMEKFLPINISSNKFYQIKIEIQKEALWHQQHDWTTWLKVELSKLIWFIGHTLLTILKLQTFPVKHFETILNHESLSLLRQCYYFFEYLSLSIDTGHSV